MADDEKVAAPSKITTMQARLERLLLYRVWERMLEIEFVDRSIALAGKAFVSFFPLVIVIAAFVSAGLRSSIVTAIARRLGITGESLEITREAFASSADVKRATDLLGLVLVIFFATSFTTALQRVYHRVWRRPRPAKAVSKYAHGLGWLIAILAMLALLGALSDVLAPSLLVVVSLVVTSCLWWFTAWYFLFGDVRARVLLPTGVITGLALTAFTASAPIWMPDVVTSNEAQFGVFGIALALVTWFSGASLCILIGACAGAVFAEDVGAVGRFIRGGEASTLTADASPPLPAPERPRTLRDAFDSEEDT
jgi:membrane protein